VGPKKAVVLLNPASGASRLGLPQQALKQAAQSRGCPIWPSSYAGNLRVLTYQALSEGFERLIIAGGDDTVREVLWALDELGTFEKEADSRPEIGIVPLGTFNNFARYTGCSLQPAEALKRSFEGKLVWADLGRANGRLFTESVGMGLDVDAWLHFPKENPHLLFRLLDGCVAVLKALWLYRPNRYWMTINDRTEKLSAYHIAVANGSLFSASFAIAPHAIVDDGMLDRCVIPRLSKLGLLAALPLIFLGKHTAYLKGVRYQRVHKVSIHSKRAAKIRIDGRLSCQLPVRIEVLPRVLPIRI